MEVLRPPGWTVWARSDVGLVRRRNEDAWAVAGHVLRGRPGATFAVFDGLGGLPLGKEAADGAAMALPDVLRRARAPETALRRLNEAVLSTGGTTTGVVAIAAEDDGLVLLSAGDSSAYVVQDGDLHAIAPYDSGPGSMVTDHLGNRRLRGHVTRARLPPGASLLLCTDGIDRVAPKEAVQGLLEATEPAAAMEHLFGLVREAGAPDNATAVLARRDGRRP